MNASLARKCRVGPASLRAPARQTRLTVGRRSLRSLVPLYESLPEGEGRRGGYTLVEVLLVLAIMVLIAAVAWPAVQKPLARRQVQEAAGTVRTKLSNARIDAMRSSHVYAFQYLAGSGAYRFAPQDAPGDEPLAAHGDCLSAEDGSLPDGIRFLADVSPEADESADAAPQNGPPSDETGDGWSDPIYFYPDGTASDARFIVAGERGFAMRVKLRGITGSVDVGESGAVLE
jgi:prepilin-type N-terminal cleavage/methylation domain-containing protein